MTAKNTVVTGGAGFIGSHVCERLIRDGHTVICIDNLQGGNEANIHHLFAHPQFEFLHLDITTPIVLETIQELRRFGVQGKGIQEIYHCACPTSPKEFLHIRKETLWTNAVGTLNMLEWAKMYGAKLLFTSSSVVYGQNPDTTMHAEEQSTGPTDLMSIRACYDEGKRFAEASVNTYQQVFRIDTKIARIFRTYGPRMPINQGHMIPDFILAALNKQPLVIYGDETLSTTLLYIDDAVDGLIKLMEAPFGVGVVNLGGEASQRIVDVASAIIRLTKSPSVITHHDPLPSMTGHPLPNIQKAKETLQWLPLVPLDQGLQKTIEYALAEQPMAHRL